MECRDCGEEVIPYRDKPGFVDQCGGCARDIAKLGGNMIWFHKTAPYIEIKPMKEAVRFAKANARSSGSSPLRSIVTSKNDQAANEAGKAKSGAENYAQYNSKLGEKRTVKL